MYVLLRTRTTHDKGSDNDETVCMLDVPIIRLKQVLVGFGK